MDDRRTAADAEGDLASEHRLKQLRRAADVNKIDFEAMLFEIAALFRGPQPSHRPAHRREADPYSLLLCRRGKR
jgi:hypothetical protein